MGMARRHDRHPVRRHEHGRTVLLDANLWRSLLRLRSSGTPRLWTIRGLDNRMVKLALSDHWRTVC